LTPRFFWSFNFCSIQASRSSIESVSNAQLDEMQGMRGSSSWRARRIALRGPVDIVIFQRFTTPRSLLTSMVISRAPSAI